ncbi:hypothetical protein ACN47E_003713 [Coniothyrium glycines]
MADPDAPAQKRPRLDSGNPSAYNNGHAFPPPPASHHPQPTRPPSHPTLSQASSPPLSRHYAPHSLPPPQQPYTPRPQGSFPAALPSPSLGPTDIRILADPRNIPSPGQHPSHGVASASVTVPQDRLTSYRPPPAPQPAATPDVQTSRSNSFSVDSKPTPLSSGPMENQHPYWTSNPEHRNGSSGVSSNGYAHTISPPHSAGPQPYQAPPPPPPGGQPYAQPPQPQQYPQPAYAPSPYMGNYAGDQQVRRKQVRATQACNHCRSRKQKCDEARPCQFCRENNFDCQYKDVPPPKQDRSMMQLQETMNLMSEKMESFMGNMTAWRQDVENKLLHGRTFEMNANHPSPGATFTAPSRDQSRWPTPTQQRSQPQRVNSMKMESPMAPPQHMSPNGTQATTPIKQESSFSQAANQTENVGNYLNGSSRTAEHPPKEKSGLQSDHTTPAHKLLEEWHTMKAFYTDVDYLTKLVQSGQKVSAYPMQLERDRGLLRVWGVGEGQDLHDGAQAPGSPDSSNESDVLSPAPGKEGLWGHPPTDHASPSTMSVSTPQELTGNEGGLGSDGRPIFHSTIVWELLESYMRYMHVLHPFMNAGKLKRMVRDFIEQYSPDIKGPHVRSPAAGALQHPYGQGVKRKRSSSAYGDGCSSRGAIERSLRNAIVLLVLALGKAFQFEAKTLPNPEKDRNVGGSWGPVRNPSQSFTSDASEETRQRNIDILPGMAYFAYATDILGNQQGGNTIAHAHAMILAALYLSQFARVLESWSWINNACRITLVLVKADYENLQRDWYMKHRLELPAKEQYRLNQIMLVYWTCLQLESDILAEMSTLPPSGISAHQGEIMYPNGVSETFPSEEGTGFLNERPDVRKGEEDDKSMMIYSSQIWLRVILNEAHNALYGSGGQGSFDTTNIRDVAKVANIHLEILESWRRMLPAQLKWEDDEPPATDLNIARLRAKYYGGLYMMLRPYLRIASHNIELPPEGARSNAYSYSQRNPSQGGFGESGRNVQMVDLSQGQQDIINIACRGIDSAIRSTVAFDRVGADPTSPYNDYRSTRTKRLVVTNIFGTLHAQFGNMLVLTSVFTSRLLSLLPKDTKLTKKNLVALLERTMTILDEVRPNSPILAIDLAILASVRKKHELF